MNDPSVCASGAGAGSEATEPRSRAPSGLGAPAPFHSESRPERSGGPRRGWRTEHVWDNGPTSGGVLPPPCRCSWQAERAGSAATGGARDCSGNWRERSDRRLQRKARSRSDAPNPSPGSRFVVRGERWRTPPTASRDPGAVDVPVGRREDGLAGDGVARHDDVVARRLRDGFVERDPCVALLHFRPRRETGEAGSARKARAASNAARSAGARPGRTRSRLQKKVGSRRRAAPTPRGGGRMEGGP